MPRPFPEFDRTKLRVLPLSEREHGLDLSCILPLEPLESVRPELDEVAARVVAARRAGAAVVLLMGAHVIRSGVQRFLIDLIEKGFITCLAGNGAVAIHDYEFARIGATTESVARYIKDGRFGLWRETGEINEIVHAAAARGDGAGAAIGDFISNLQFPHRDISVLDACARCGIPATIHAGIGYDIVHEHPNCDGAAWGAASYTDFLRFAAALESLQGGVVMNFGSSVMGPEVYLKALAMARNVAEQQNRKINDFTVLVCDIKPLPETYASEACREEPDYYFRPWKTMLVRTVAGGGRGLYVRGSHAETVPELWSAIMSHSKRANGHEMEA